MNFISIYLKSFSVHTAWAQNPDEKRGTMDITAMFLSQPYQYMAVDALIMPLPVLLSMPRHSLSYRV